MIMYKRKIIRRNTKNISKTKILFASFALSQILIIAFLIDARRLFASDLSKRPNIAHNVVNRVSIKKIKINGISLGASEKETIKTFGKPIKVERITDDGQTCLNRGDKLVILYYERTKLQLINGYLEIVNTTNSRYKTESNVGVGDKIDLVKSKYKSIMADRNSSSTYLKFIPLRLIMKNGIVNEIILANYDGGFC